MATESWVGSETSIGTEQLGSTWDQVRLGDAFLPGVCSIDNFKIGQNIDVQKKRKKEKARLRDNGAEPCSFKIIVEITGALWGDWQRVLPSIQPQRPGAVRRPLQIAHPLPNSNGVSDVYVREIEYGAPSARTGMKITISVAEWFEEEKETAPQNKEPKPLKYTRQDAAFVDYAQKLVSPSNPDNMHDRGFGDDEEPAFRNPVPTLDLNP